MSSEPENTPEPARVSGHSRKKTKSPIIELSADEVTVVKTEAPTDAAATSETEAVAVEPVVTADSEPVSVDAPVESGAVVGEPVNPDVAAAVDAGRSEIAERRADEALVDEVRTDAASMTPAETSPDVSATSEPAAKEPEKAETVAESPVVEPGPAIPLAAVAAKPAGRGLAALLMAAVFGGVVVLGGGYGLLRSGLISLPIDLPAPADLAPVTGRIDALDAKVVALGQGSDALGGRLQVLEQAPVSDVAGLTKQVEDLGAKLAAVSAATPGGEINPDIAALPTAVAALAAEAEKLKGEIAALKTGGTDKAATDALTASVAKLTARLDALPAPVDGARIDKLEAATTALGDKLGALPAPIDPTRIDRLESSLAELSAKADGLNSSMSGVIAALTERTAGIEKRLDAGPQGGEIAAVSLSLAALSSKIASGEPFNGELAVVKSAKPDAGDLSALDALAATGAPTAATLLASLPVEAVLAARPESTSGGVLDALFSGAQSLVNYRETGDGVEDAAYKALAGIDAALKAGDFKGARSAADGLPDWGRAAAGDWLTRLDQRAAADATLASLTSGVLDRLKAPAQGQ